MRHTFVIGDTEHAAWLSRARRGYALHLRDLTQPATLEPLGEDRYRLTLGAVVREIMLVQDGDTTFVYADGITTSVRYVDPVAHLGSHGAGDSDDVALAPMPGVAVVVHTHAGAQVALGDTLLVIESMKLETAIKAWRDGTVAEVHLAAGQTFERGAPLITLAPQRGT
jgi:acetyl/propionyl-CoA carboxylase alpha subunit